MNQIKIESLFGKTKLIKILWFIETARLVERKNYTQMKKNYNVAYIDAYVYSCGMCSQMKKKKKTKNKKNKNKRWKSSKPSETAEMKGAMRTQSPQRGIRREG